MTWISKCAVTKTKTKNRKKNLRLKNGESFCDLKINWNQSQTTKMIGKLCDGLSQMNGRLLNYYRQNIWKSRYVGTDEDSGGVVVVLFVVVLVVFDAEFSGMVKCHKFVVCTSPLSKLKHSSTAAPIELRRVTMLLIMVHLLSCGSYFSTELSDELPSLPPNAYK